MPTTHHHSNVCSCVQPCTPDTPHTLATGMCTVLVLPNKVGLLVLLVNSHTPTPPPYTCCAHDPMITTLQCRLHCSLHLLCTNSYENHMSMQAALQPDCCSYLCEYHSLLCNLA